MMEISRDVHHRPIVFIRFNTDSYKDENNNLVRSCWRLNKQGVVAVCKTRQTEWNSRLAVLSERVQHWIDTPAEKTLELDYLFYGTSHN